MPAELEVHQILKGFPDPAQPDAWLPVLHDISFTASAGETIAVLGPSGCGKTTLLDIIDGLRAQDAGSVLHRGNPVNEPSPERAFVFQGVDLLPWRTAVENAAFGLEIQGLARHDAIDRARPFLELAGLAEFADYYPHELSGGMQQRVGIARALAVEPTMLLLDEPFGALDALTRESLQQEFISILEQREITVVLVTHDIEEALFFADRIVVLSSRPARVMAELEVELPRPRSLPRARQTRAFIEQRQAVWELLTGTSHDQEHDRS